MLTTQFVGNMQSKGNKARMNHRLKKGARGRRLPSPSDDFLLSSSFSLVQCLFAYTSAATRLLLLLPLPPVLHRLVGGGQPDG
jgi:hypothetical protein